MSRIGQAGIADYGDRIELVHAIEAGRGWIPNIFKTMLFSPELTGGWVQLANSVRLSSTLDIRTRELVILLVARLHDSSYEWEHHRHVATDIGITADEVSWLAAWPAGDWHDRDRAVLTFAAATASRSEVPQWCIDDLLERNGHRFVVDLAVTASYYVAVAHFAAALKIEREPLNPAQESTGRGAGDVSTP